MSRPESRGGSRAARPAGLDGRQRGGEPGLVRRLRPDRRLGRVRRRRRHSSAWPGRGWTSPRREKTWCRWIPTAKGSSTHSPHPAAKHRSSGTSYAAPVVTGIVALLRARSPELTARQVMQRIEDTAHRPPAGWDPVVGHGIVDALAAVTGGPDASAAPGLAATASRVEAIASPTRRTVPGKLPFEGPRSAWRCQSPWWR